MLLNVWMGLFSRWGGLWILLLLVLGFREKVKDSFLESGRQMLLLGTSWARKFIKRLHNKVRIGLYRSILWALWWWPWRLSITSSWSSGQATLALSLLMTKTWTTRSIHLYMHKTAQKTLMAEDQANNSLIILSANNQTICAVRATQPSRRNQMSFEKFHTWKCSKSVEYLLSP